MLQRSGYRDSSFDELLSSDPEETAIARAERIIRPRRFGVRTGLTAIAAVVGMAAGPISVGLGATWFGARTVRNYQQHITNDRSKILKTLFVDAPVPDGTGPKAKTVVAIGDSYASGPAGGDIYASSVDVEPDGTRHIDSDGAWVSQNAPIMEVATAFDANAGNFSHAGATSARVMRQVRKIPTNADVVVISDGGNDFQLIPAVAQCIPKELHAPCADSILPEVLADADRVRQNIEGVINAVKARVPNAIVVLAGYPDPLPEPSHLVTGCDPIRRSDDDALQKGFQEIMRVQQQAAQNTGVAFFNPNPVFKAKGYLACTDTTPYLDGTLYNLLVYKDGKLMHLNKAGNIEYGDALAAFIQGPAASQMQDVLAPASLALGGH